MVFRSVLALRSRISLIFLLGSYKHAAGSEVINIAISLAKTGDFADAYGPGSGPTAHASARTWSRGRFSPLEAILGVSAAA